MIPLSPRGVQFPWRAFVLMVGIGFVSHRGAIANDPVATCSACASGGGECRVCHRVHQSTSGSAWGFGGASPVFQGFGLGYHLGYGYGGAAIGVGPDGGYPFYGGPGYPHGEPALRRIGGINPFPYFGGPGEPVPGHPNFFGSVGLLVPVQPVITIGDDQYDTGYGSFTGSIPYPESVLAPFTTRAGAGKSVGGASSTNPSPPATNPAPDGGGAATLHDPGQSIGIDADPVVDAGGVRGIKITKVHPGSAAEKAYFHPGDVIQSINGYRTELPDHLTWIIAKKAPNNMLNMSVRTASDGKVHTLKVQIP